MPRARDWLIGLAVSAPILALAHFAFGFSSTRLLVMLLFGVTAVALVFAGTFLASWLIGRTGDGVASAITTALLVGYFVAIRHFAPIPDLAGLLRIPAVIFPLIAWLTCVMNLGSAAAPAERNGCRHYNLALGWRILLFLIGPVLCVLMLQQEPTKPIHAWMAYAWLPLAGFLGALVLLPQVALGDGEIRVRRWWLGRQSYALADLRSVECVGDGSALELGFADGRKRTVDGMIAGLGDLEARLNGFLPARG